MDVHFTALGGPFGKFGDTEAQPKRLDQGEKAQEQWRFFNAESGALAPRTVT